MSAISESLDALNNRLDSLEHLLESPIVPGEMRVRCENVCQELTELAQTFAVHRCDAHEPQFSQIEQTDAEMLSRVEQMRQEDQAISSEIERLCRSFADCGAAVQTVEDLPQHDEAELAGAIPPLVGDALALVIRVRMQENALATWFVEAFQRDRGVAD